MSKAEDLAKKYCEGSSFEDACMEKPAYIAGYHQAEEDLEPTNADVYEIWRIYNEVCAEGKIFGFDETNQEVLRRYKERKEK